MTKEKKQTLQLIVAIIAFAFGCVLVAAGFVSQPIGEIHPSVLTAFGEALTFSGSIIGVDYHYRYKYSKDAQD